MYARELERIIRKKNQGLWVNWKDANPDYGEHGSAGLNWNGEYVCALPLIDMPERTRYRADGGIEARGWLDVLDILKNKGYIR